MSSTISPKQTNRQGELLAELFLQDLGAQFVAQSPTPDFLYDFFIGFPNKRGGVNTFAVEVKVTSRPVKTEFSLLEDTFKLLSSSNIPTLLLIIDVKENEYYYTWPNDRLKVSRNKNQVKFPVIKFNSRTRARLLKEMTR